MGLALAVALPLGADAQSPVLATKATTSHHKGLQKVQQLPQAKPLKVKSEHRAIDRTVNGRMLSTKLTATPRRSFRLPGLAAEPVATSAPLCGSVIYSDAWKLTGEADYNVSAIPTDGSDALTPLFSTELGASYGGVAVDGKYYVTDLYEFWGMRWVDHQVYDIETGEMIDDVISEDFSELATDMTYDPKTGNVYGCFYNEEASGFQFATMDLNTFATTAICDLDMLWNACACDADGNLYAIDSAGVLYSVNKSTGAMTEIGNTGVEPYYTSSATIDPKTGTMFWTVSPLDECGYLYTVDTATAQATLVSQFANNDEIAGLFIPAPAAEEGAPAAISDLAADFLPGSFTGVVTFTAPDALFDGSDPTDTALQYTVLCNGEPVAQGTTTFGADVEAEVTVPASGDYTFTVYVSNAVGDSPKATVSLWVGIDTPVAPENVELSYADGTMTLTWDAVVDGVHDGFVDDITYTVTRVVNDEATVVAEGLTDCEFTEAMAEPAALTSVYYTVKAVGTDAASAATKSNAVVLGSIVPPYSVDFREATDIDGYTVIDANGDGTTWKLSDGMGVRVAYNTAEDMDDWFITPPMKLEGGKLYTLTFVAKAQSSNYPERLEVGFASEATAAALAADIIIEPTELLGVDTEFTATVAPEADGKYYFGIHGISDADQYYINLLSLSVSAGRTATVPAAPTALAVVPDADGGKTAVVTFTAPAVNAEGGEITALTSATILANGEKVAEIANPTPGADVGASIEVPASGEYTIAAYVSNADGDGLVAEVKTFIGVNIPAAPTNVQAAEIGNTGKVIVSWEAPATDKDGNPINPAFITYTVVNYNDDVLAEGVTGTSVEVTAWEGEGQTFDYFDVTAVTEAGSSKAASSPMIAIGTPFEMPVVETFTDGNFDYGMGAIDYGAEWYVFDLETLASVLGFGPEADSDDTDGLAMMYGTSLYASADLFTGKIDVTGKSPVVSFAYYVQEADDENELDVLAYADGEFHRLGETIVMNEGEPGTWVTKQYSLAQYEGKTVQIYFRGAILAYTTIFIDRIAVYNLLDNDLAITEISAPAKVAPGEEFDINVTVANEGAFDVDGYDVALTINGEALATVNCGPLAAGTSTVVNFAHTFSPVDAEENVFEATVVFEADENLTNNSIEYPVILDIPNYPTPADLTAEDTTEGVVLNWAEPDMNDLPKLAVTDDFESCEPFAVEASPWTLVDVDGAAIGGINGIDIPVSACAYFVFDASGDSFNDSFAAHSGDKYLSTMYNSNGSKQSDWMISPALSGNAQTISFYARSYTDQYGLETVSVYYSTTDNDPASFTKISTKEVPAAWTEITADLPAGALYFAIVCESQDVFMLFVDDVTYIPADGEAMTLTLMGYNVYRDDVKINEAPVEDTTYTDAATQGVHEYKVTAVYAEGESGPSNAASLTTALNALRGDATVQVAGRQIRVSGAKGIVSVYTADGKTVYSAEAAATNTVTVAPGVYMVRAGKLVNKVIVK